MSRIQATDVRGPRELRAPTATGAPRSSSSADAEEFFADLRASFVQTTKADRCVIKLSPGWRRVVGKWLGPAAGASTDVERPEAVPVSWIKVRQDGLRSEVQANLLLGGVSAAQIVVTTRRRRGLAHILRTLTTFIPKVSSRLCLRWLREEASAYERRRLVQDLHDGPLQLASAAKVRLQSCRQTTHDPAAVGALDEAVELMGQVVSSMRALLHDRIQEADTASLKGHLRRAATRWGQLTGMRVHFSFPEDAPDAATALSKETLEVAEHVVSESIANAWKHGKATELSVRCRPHNGGVLLTLRDDGCGLRAAIDAGGANGTKMGLRLLRSRVAEVGGWFEVRSPEEGGTLVETWLPPSQAPHDDPA